ncbi:uncharacterized [Tachysurus ichikawai]
MIFVIVLLSRGRRCSWRLSKRVLDKLRLSCGLDNDDLLPKSWAVDDLQMTVGAKKKCAEIRREIRCDDVT